MTIKITPGQAVKFQMDKAIREGRLHKVCFKNFGQEYTEKNFCPGCGFRETCAREGRKAKGGENAT